MISSRAMLAMSEEMQNLVKESAAFYNPHLNVNVKAVKLPKVRASSTSSAINKAKKKEKSPALNIKPL